VKKNVRERVSQNESEASGASAFGEGSVRQGTKSSHSAEISGIALVRKSRVRGNECLSQKVARACVRDVRALDVPFGHFLTHSPL
jgi:hypothetical protein